MTVDATCPECGAKTRTTLGVPDTQTESAPELYEEGGFGYLPPEAQQAADTILKRVKNDPEILEAVNTLFRLGFAPAMVLAILKLPEGAEPQPNLKVETRVDDQGNIKAGTFSEEDADEFQKIFKIKL